MNIIEKVARAIYSIPDGIHTVKFDELNIDAQNNYKNKAKLAIEAMKEPTEEMHHAARDWSYKKYGNAIGDAASKGCWQSMIEAALKQ